MHALETVKVINDDSECGYTIINKTEFKDGDFKLFKESSAEIKEGSMPWLKDELKKRDIDIPDGAKKAELEVLYFAAIESE